MQKIFDELNPNAQEEVTKVISEELNFLISNMFNNPQDFFDLVGGYEHPEEFEKYVSDLVAVGVQTALGRN